MIWIYIIGSIIVYVLVVMFLLAMITGYYQQNPEYNGDDYEFLYKISAGFWIFTAVPIITWHLVFKKIYKKMLAMWEVKK